MMIRRYLPPSLHAIPNYGMSSRKRNQEMLAVDRLTGADWFKKKFFKRRFASSRKMSPVSIVGKAMCATEA